jgi:hypothetical protein
MASAANLLKVGIGLILNCADGTGGRPPSTVVSQGSGRDITPKWNPRKFLLHSIQQSREAGVIPQGIQVRVVFDPLLLFHPGGNGFFQTANGLLCLPQKGIQLGDVVAGISVLNSRPTDILHLTASACNAPARFRVQSLFGGREPIKLVSESCSSL